MTAVPSDLSRMPCAHCEAGDHDRCDGTFTVLYRTTPGGREQTTTGPCACKHRRLADKRCSNPWCSLRPVGYRHTTSPDGTVTAEPACGLHADAPLP